MRGTKFRLLVLATAALLIAGCSSSTGGDGASDAPLSGKTIDFVVPYEPGGGFDLYVRLIAPHLAKELDARIVVRNEPAAGGIAAMNKTWNAEPDGTRILLADIPGGILNELSGQGGARYKIADFSWMARVAGEPETVVSSAKDGAKSMESLVDTDKELVFSSVGVYDSDSIGAQLVGEVFDLKVKTVTGFDGAPEAFTAVLRGDTDAFNVSAGSARDYEKNGEGKALAVLDTKTSEVLPDVMPLSEVPGAEDNKDLIEIHGALVSSGRSIIGPPKLPKEILDAYRKALDKVLNDPSFLKEAKAQERVVQYLSGEEVADLVSAAASDPDPRYIELIKRAGENAAG